MQPTGYHFFAFCIIRFHPVSLAILSSLDIHDLTKLYKARAQVRFHLESSNSIWLPFIMRPENMFFFFFYTVVTQLMGSLPYSVVSAGPSLDSLKMHLDNFWIDSHSCMIFMQH